MLCCSFFIYFFTSLWLQKVTIDIWKADKHEIKFHIDLFSKYVGSQSTTKNKDILKKIQTSCFVLLKSSPVCPEKVNLTFIR